MNNKKILKELSIKYGKDVRVIDTITRHPFKFLYELMQSNSEKPFRIKYFGVFAVKNSKLRKAWQILELDR
jgi:hypothetical protein